MMNWTYCRNDTVSPSQSSLSSLDRIYTRNVNTTQNNDPPSLPLSEWIKYCLYVGGLNLYLNHLSVPEALFI